MENETSNETTGEMRSLTDRQRAMLDFERTWWQFDEPREALIATRFGCTAEAYATELAIVLELPAALAHDPMVVRRHHRRRVRRRSEVRGAVTSTPSDGTMQGHDAGITMQGHDAGMQP